MKHYDMHNYLASRPVRSGYWKSDDGMFEYIRDDDAHYSERWKLRPTKGNEHLLPMPYYTGRTKYDCGVIVEIIYNLIA